MKKILLAFILICNVSFGADIQKVTGIENKDLHIMNENWRKVNKELTSIRVLSRGGFGIVLSGDAETGTDVIPSRYYLPVSGSFTKIKAYAKTAPSGSSLIIDVNINGTSILESGRVAIASGSNLATVTDFETSAFSADDYLTIDIDQIGSSTAGSDIVLSFFVLKTS